MRKKKATLKIIIYFLVFKFFEGFLGETFFQESSPKCVPYKSKFDYQLKPYQYEFTIELQENQEINKIFCITAS